MGFLENKFQKFSIFNRSSRIDMSVLHHEMRRVSRLSSQLKHLFKNFGPKMIWGEMGLFGPLVQKKAIFGGHFVQKCAWWMQHILAAPTGRKWIGHIPKCSKVLKSLSESA